MGQIGREKRYKRKGEREKSVKKFLKQLSNVLLSVIGFFIICILAYFILTTSTEKASWYTEEEHIERVSERVQEQIKTGHMQTEKNMRAMNCIRYTMKKKN